MLYIVGIVITFFLAIVLVSKRNKSASDKILAGWLAVMGLHLLFFYLFVTGKNVTMPALLGFELPFPLFHGPFLFLYTASLTGQTKAMKLGFLHFLPILVCYMMFFDFFFLPSEQKVAVYAAKGQGHETVLFINRALIMASGVIYFILSLWLLRTHKKNLQNQFSYTEKINLNWLRYLIYSIGLIWVSVFIGPETVTFGITVVFVIFLGYFGINQVGVFTERPAIQLEPKKEKYQKSSLNEESGQAIHQALNSLMREKKLYTNPELTLAELAQALDVHPNNLSQVINTFEQKSFYDYINLMRIEEFKRLAALPENQKFNLLGLARECGFNSKTSFNRNFKNATGQSPTEYLKLRFQLN